jgi:hypothetical protein
VKTGTYIWIEKEDKNRHIDRERSQEHAYRQREKTGRYMDSQDRHAPDKILKIRSVIVKNVRVLPCSANFGELTLLFENFFY